MERLSLACASMALSGLLLVYWFSPGKQFMQKTASELLEECTGFVKLSGKLSSFFYTRTGRPAAEISGVLVLLPSSVEASRITVYGKASIHNSRCWILAEKVETSA